MTDRVPLGRLIAAVLVVACLAGVPTAAAAGSTSSETLTGVVRGDGAAQQGYEVSLYASAVSGKQRVRRLGTDTTDRAGRFEIDYRPPPATRRAHRAVLYVLAEKSDAMLAGAIGAAPRHRTVVNERTTVAIGTAFAQFVDGRRISGNAYGMRNAVEMAANMADPTTGRVGAVLDNPPNGDETSTRATFNTLANVVAGCVADRASCDTLFEATTPAGGPAPTTVLQAVANTTKYPSSNVADVFALGADGPYAPALGEAPTSWLLFLKFTGAFSSDYASTNLMSGPGNVAFDRRGFAWINDNYVPTPPPPVACAGLRLLKLFPWGEPVPGSPYFGGGLSGAGFGITLDPRGRVWVGNFGFESPLCDEIPPDPASKIPATHDSVSLFRPDGSPVSPPEGFTRGGIWWPQATVSDPGGNIWVASCGNDTVTLIPRGRPSQARNIPLPGGQGAEGNLRPVYPSAQPRLKPFAIAIGPDGRAWVTANTAEEVYVVARDGTVETVETDGLLSRPMGISTDSRGNMWVSNSSAVDVPCVTPFAAMEADDPSVVLLPADGSAPSKHTGGGLSVPWGSAVDGNDTPWVFNFGRNPSLNADEDTIWPDTGVSHICGADVGKCPAGLGTGDAISPADTGYASDALDRVTGGGVDPSGNLWLLNNWKKNGPFAPVFNTNPGGNSFVIVPGAAKPIRTPLIGPPVAFGTD